MSEFDKKISALTSGTDSTATDEYVIARGGSNFKISGALVAAGATKVGTLASLAVTGNVSLGADVVLSRGAADRLDLASGDSLNIVSGTVKIAGTDVLGATTLGSGVTASSLTSVGTLSALTVSGDLTVDTDTLKVDAAGNRVLMGLSAAIQGDALEIQSKTDGGSVSLFGRASDNGSTIAFRANGVTTQKAAILGGDEGLRLVTGTTVRATIDASGNVGIGVTSVSSSISGSARVLGICDSGTTNLGSLRLGSGSTFASGNRMEVFAGASTVGLYGETNVPMTFTTNATERARITAGGYFKASNDGTYLGSTSAYHELRQAADSFGVILTAPIAAYTSTLIYGDVSGTASGTGFNMMDLRASGTTQFNVRGDGNATNTNGSYGTISDAKLKQDITDAGSSWDDLKAVRFRKYRFISDVEAKGEDAPVLLGVVAQELEQTSPGLVDESPDYENVEVEVEVEKSRPVLDEDGEPMLDEDGEPLTETYTETETRTERKPTGTTTKSVKSSILLMKAAVALQEAMARIESLEARLDALEN
jgi:hypothetical protein